MATLGVVDPALSFEAFHDLMFSHDFGSSRLHGRRGARDEESLQDSVCENHCQEIFQFDNNAKEGVVDRMAYFGEVVCETRSADEKHTFGYLLCERDEPEDPNDDYDSHEEQDASCTPLTSPAAKADNKRLWLLIADWVRKTPDWTHIKHCKNSQDGREASSGCKSCSFLITLVILR
jgi:hypothetical protein